MRIVLSFIKHHVLSLLITLPALLFSQSDFKSNTTTEANTSRISLSDPITQFLDSARLLADKYPLRAIDKINKAIEFCIINKESSREATAYLVLGDLQQKLGQYELAINNYHKCIALNSVLKPRTRTFKSLQREGNPNEVFTALKNMAYCQLKLNQIDSAFVSVNLVKRKEFDNIVLSEKLDVQRIYGQILVGNKETLKALSVFKEVLNSEVLAKNEYGEAKTLLLIGETQLALKDYIKAQETLTKTIEISDKYGFINQSQKANELLADLFRIQKETSKEVEIRTNLATGTYSWQTNGAVSNAVVQNIEIGNSYFSANMLDKAITHYNLACSNVLEANNSVVQWGSMQVENLEKTANAMKTLTEFYLKKGDLENAKIYFNKYNELQDSLKSSRKLAFDEAVNIGTGLGKSQQKIDLLEKERNLSERSVAILKEDQRIKDDAISQRNTIIGTLVFCIVFLLFGGYFLNKNYREKRKVNQILAIKSLQGQMNPHFIFNALNSVNNYISKNDEKSANKYLSDFSRLMRSVMENSKHDMIPLADELEMLKLYLSLEHSRFPEKFTYSFVVDKNISINNFEIPPMIIQPYIENAVWHGLRYLENNKGELNVEFCAEGENLVVKVYDNGIGRKKSIELKTKNQKKQKSLGMQNIENRIELMNQLYGIEIKVSIEDAFPGSENSGTKVQIIIPKRTI